MNCKKCGTLIEPNSKFCNVCGTRVEDANDFFSQPSGAQTSSGNTFGSGNFGQTPPKPKKNKKILVPVIAAVLVVFVVAGVFAGIMLKNFISKSLMSPDEYLLHVEEKNTEFLADNITNYITALKKGTNFSNGASGEVNVKLGNDLKNMLLSQGGAEASQYLGWINSAGVTVDFAQDNNQLGYKLGLKVNDVQTITADAVADFSEEALYLSVPEINQTAIRISASDLGITPEARNAIVNSFTQINEVVPDEKIISDIICRYMNAAASQLKNVTETEDTISAGGISKSSTLLTVTIDEKTAIDMATAVLTELKNDQNVKDILADLATFSGEDPATVTAEFESAVNESLAELANASATAASGDEVILKVWVDSDDNIEGIGVVAGTSSFTFISVKDGKNTATQFDIQGPGVNVSVSGTGKESGSVTSGEYNVSVNGTPIVKITCTDINKKLLDKGVVNGKITIEAAPGLSDILAMVDYEAAAVGEFIEKYKLELNLKSDSPEESDCEISVYYQNSLYLSVGIKSSLKSNYKIQKPASYVDAQNGQQWAATLDFNALVNILAGAGAPSAVTDPISQLGAMASLSASMPEPVA